MKPVTIHLLDLSAPGGAITRHDPGDTLVRVDDLGITRGDGIFETAGVRHGVPMALDAHLARFARSAAMMDLPAPDPGLWRGAVTAVASELAGVEGQAAVKFIMTRGTEGDPDSSPTGWALGFVADDPAPARSRGLDVVLLDRGYRHDVAQTSPWLLQGAKTLSYAVNKAALREAARRGADDVIFTSCDGYVLEGPSSTLVARIDGAYVTPPTTLGILPGTTQGDIFADLERRGAATRVGALSVADLETAGAMWLCSSTRGAAPIRSLDGRDITVDHRATDQINADLDARRG